MLNRKHHLWNAYTALGLLVVILLTGFLAGSTSALAQGSTQVFVSPQMSEVSIGGLAEVKLEVKNGVELNAYDVTVVYDPAVLTLESWRHGGYMTNLGVIVQVNEPGRLNIVAVQLGIPGVSGDGTLLNMSFRAKSAGSSAVQVQELTFARSSGEKVFPELFSGVVNSSPAQLPSPTITLAPFVTWTATSTRVPTNAGIPTITPIYAQVITRTSLPETLSSPSSGGLEMNTANAGVAQTPTQGQVVFPFETAQPVIEQGAALEASPGSTAYATEVQGMQNKTLESIKGASRENGMVWSVGALILAGLTGLVTLFLNLWKKL